MNMNGTDYTTPLLLDPRIVVEPHGEQYLRLRFQDRETKADLVIVKIPRELAGALATEFQSVAPSPAPGAVASVAALILDEEEMS